MILIDGKKAAAELREELKQEVSGLKSRYNKSPRFNCDINWRSYSKVNLCS